MNHQPVSHTTNAVATASATTPSSQHHVDLECVCQSPAAWEDLQRRVLTRTLPRYYSLYSALWNQEQERRRRDDTVVSAVDTAMSSNSKSPIRKRSPTVVVAAAAEAAVGASTAANEEEGQDNESSLAATPEQGEDGSVVVSACEGDEGCNCGPFRSFLPPDMLQQQQHQQPARHTIRNRENDNDSNDDTTDKDDSGDNSTGGSSSTCSTVVAFYDSWDRPVARLGEEKEDKTKVEEEEEFVVEPTGPAPTVIDLVGSGDEECLDEDQEDWVASPSDEASLTKAKLAASRTLSQSAPRTASDIDKKTVEWYINSSHEEEAAADDSPAPSTASPKASSAVWKPTPQFGASRTQSLASSNGSSSDQENEWGEASEAESTDDVVELVHRTQRVTIIDSDKESSEGKRECHHQPACHTIRNGKNDNDSNDDATDKDDSGENSIGGSSSACSTVAAFFDSWDRPVANVGRETEPVEEEKEFAVEPRGPVPTVIDLVSSCDEECLDDEDQEDWVASTADEASLTPTASRALPQSAPCAAIDINKKTVEWYINSSHEEEEEDVSPASSTASPKASSAVWKTTPQFGASRTQSLSSSNGSSSDQENEWVETLEEASSDGVVELVRRTKRVALVDSDEESSEAEYSKESSDDEEHFFSDQDSFDSIDYYKKRKSPALSKAEFRRKRAPALSKVEFRRKRENLAQYYFLEFDRTIFDGKLKKDTSVAWNNKLLTTAGRTRLKTLRRGTEATRIAHIELSSKVLDNADRLRSTLVHEMCHAAMWIMDSVFKPPHGHCFIKWSNLAMQREPGVNVTTTHNYEITYKYAWACQEPTCDFMVQRQSRSVDVHKHLCGRCRGRLMEIKVPESGATTFVPLQRAPPSAYNLFVKEQSAAARRRLEKIMGNKVPQEQVLRECARMWRENKQEQDAVEEVP